MSTRRPEGPGGGPCCPLPPGVPPLDRDGEAQASPAATARLAAVARALAEPVRLRMLALMATAAPCCEPAPPENGPAGGRPGVCVCELQGLFGLAQSTVSHHLRVLREAGLVKESRRGKWVFYRVDETAARAALAALAAHLGVGGPAGQGRAEALTGDTACARPEGAARARPGDAPDPPALT